MVALSLLISLAALLSMAVAPPLAALDLPWLLLGTRLVLDDTGRFFLGFTALVWLAMLLAASWPLALGGGLAWLAAWHGGHLWAPPPGDVLALIERPPFMTPGTSNGQEAAT